MWKLKADQWNGLKACLHNLFLFNKIKYIYSCGFCMLTLSSLEKTVWLGEIPWQSMVVIPEGLWIALWQKLAESSRQGKTMRISSVLHQLLFVSRQQELRFLWSTCELSSWKSRISIRLTTALQSVKGYKVHKNFILLNTIGCSQFIVRSSDLQDRTKPLGESTFFLN